MLKPMRIIVLIIFLAGLTTSAIIIPKVEIGLDQQLSMPVDSYVYKYFEVVFYFNL
jgi:Niemann-Pick C1 protein